VALFDHHPPVNALAQAGLRGKCPNRPKSDFLSEGEGNGVGGADGITQALLTTTHDRGCAREAFRRLRGNGRGGKGTFLGGPWQKMQRHGRAAQ
jgi:hypothetical protein